jgi:membrane associated rhomboid family serine protease
LLPLKDLNPTRSRPVVTAGLLIANVAVWILYELPNGLDRSILVFWFVFQLLVGTSSLTSPETGGGVAYFAHIGGFAFGALTIRPLRVGRAR